MEYCTHIVYGYVGLRPDTFDVETLNSRQHQQFTQIKKIKNQYRHIKFLVSLGGDKDLKNPEKYMKLLEANTRSQENFINSASTFLRKYSFDGLDLAYQFPHNKSKKSSAKKILDKGKKLLKNNPIANKFVPKKSKKVGGSSKVLMQKQQFTALVNRLKNTLRRDRLLLTLTVLPHVNTTSELVALFM